MTAVADISLIESVKPVPVRVRPGLWGRIAFGFRRLLDLQTHTVWLTLANTLPKVRGSLLDVGCGEMPFRFALHPDVKYTGLDVEQAVTFDIVGDDDIRLFDGFDMPFPDNHFDNVLCTEVLEHAVDPVQLVKEMHRVLKPGGKLVLTVPFSARVHYAPYDFHRFTRFRLAEMFKAFGKADVIPRGSDIVVIANKLIVLQWRLMLRPSRWMILHWLFAILLAPVTALFGIIGHLAIIFGWGSVDDPLGYSIVAMK